MEEVTDGECSNIHVLGVLVISIRVMWCLDLHAHTVLCCYLQINLTCKNSNRSYHNFFSTLLCSSVIERTLID